MIAGGGFPIQTDGWCSGADALVQHAFTGKKRDGVKGKGEGYFPWGDPWRNQNKALTQTLSIKQNIIHTNKVAYDKNKRNPLIR